MTAVPERPDPGAESIDEELGSPVARFERGWLLGIALGIAALVLFTRARRRRRRWRDSADNLYR